MIQGSFTQSELMLFKVKSMLSPIPLSPYREANSRVTQTAQLEPHLNLNLLTNFQI